MQVAPRIPDADEGELAMMEKLDALGSNFSEKNWTYKTPLTSSRRSEGDAENFIQDIGKELGALDTKRDTLSCNEMHVFSTPERRAKDIDAKRLGGPTVMPTKLSRNPDPVTEDLKQLKL